jgi:hypothetical protein
VNAAPPPPKEPAAPADKPGILRRVWKVIAGVSVGLGVIATGVTQWDTIESALFPTSAASEATIVAGVEPDISLGEFDAQARLPGRPPGSTAAVAPNGSPRTGTAYRFAVYAVPAISQPSTGTLIDVSSEEAHQTIKAEGEKITEEAKRDEENSAREEEKAAAEAKAAEAHEQEEQKKEQAAQKRVEESTKPGVGAAKAEEATAKAAVEAASRTVHAREAEAVRPASQLRIEVGTPARVEAVLHEAQLPEQCHPTCGLKPIVEKVLKDTSDNVAQAARVARTVASHGSGARVHFEVTVKGLEHKEVVLAYALVQTNGAAPPPAYLGPVAIKRFAPGREREVIVGDCWVPVPSDSRQYYVELTVYDGVKEVAWKDTSRFQ